MAPRQIWLFLAEADVGDLLARLEAHEPGLVASRGRYLRGNADDLIGQPSVLERRESLPAEERHYLFHRKHSAHVVAHLQPAGPFAGWSQIDEERSDCLVLRVPVLPGNELGPSRLYASTSFWRGPTKIRKRPMFAIWANQTLRWLIGQYPSTAVEFMRVGPQALQGAKSGARRLTYLYREIAAEPAPGGPPIARPEGTVMSGELDDSDG